MKHYIILLLLLYIGPYGWSQQYTTKATASNRVKKMFERVEHYSVAEQYDEALEELEKILKTDPQFLDGWLQRANIYFDQRAYEAAAADYRKVLDMEPAYGSKALYPLALALYNQDQFGAAVPYFEQYLATGIRQEATRQRVEKYLSNARFAAEAIQHPVPFAPNRLPATINTPNPEYFPSLTADGEALVYTTRIRNQEDLYISYWRDGAWQQGIPITEVNTDQNEGTQQISADGRLLVFTACDRKDGMGRCDIYYAERQHGGWSKPSNMGPPINTGAWESQPSIAANGQALYFASNREGGFGGTDIWVSYRQPNGRWGKPENLGPMVNTSGNDQSPFIHPDGRTLYFMSDGHPGFGGSDLYKTQRNPDGSWSIPQNLGYPINTRQDESALVLSLDGTTAYFSMRSNEPASGPFPTRSDIDIYTFTMPEALRPAPVTYVKARVVDAHTQAPLVAKVEIADLTIQQLYAATTTDSDGTFLVCLPLGEDYALNVRCEGYLFHSEHFALSVVTAQRTPLLLQIELVPLSTTPTAARTIITLQNVFFETGSAQLRPASRLELNRLKTLLDEQPQMRIQLNGHTDNVGKANDNMLLSEQRAKAVYDYLISQGIAAQRLRYRGFGDTKPIDTNDTPQGRERNRRTEFEIIFN